LFLLALTPITLILVLMVGLRWGAARAGGVGYLVALAIALAAFGAGSELLAYAHVKALLLAFDVLLIIWAAFLLYRVADEAGAIRSIGSALPRLTADPGMQALLIGWVFASFLQGVGGFGVPVAVIAPILAAVGFSPLAAVVIPSIGHGWAVTFGSLGSSFAALMAATGLPENVLASPAALFLGIAGLLTGLMISHAAGGWAAVRRLAGPALILGVIMGGVQLLVARAGLWNIAAFAGGIAGLAAGLPLARLVQRRAEANGSTTAGLGAAAATAEAVDWRRLLISLSGYGVLVIVILAVQLLPGINEFLGQVVIRVPFPEMRTNLGYLTPAGWGRSLPIFRHTGLVLAYASVLAYGIYRAAGFYKAGAMRRVLQGTYQRVLGPTISILSMVTMATIMEHAGMTDTLARAMASGVGALFPLVAPWIGALGAFMTGSNTNSNVVFGGLQLRTAELLGFQAAIILAGQTAGAALASVLAPAKVVVGASTAGMAGREGEVMRKLLSYSLVLVALISLLTLAGVLWGGEW
jgi:lactate permease